MWETVRSVASLLLSYGLLLMANGMFGTLLGLRSKMEGFSTETTGLIMAFYFFGMLLGALNAAKVVARAAHIRSFAAFASVMSVAVLAHILLVHPIAWMLLRVICGFCMAGMIMIVESWMNERSTNANRGRVLSLYMMTSYLGSGTGQFLLTIADPASFELFSVASIIFSIALVPILMTRATAPQPAQPERMSFKALYKTSPVGVIGTISAGLTNSSINSLGPVFGAGISLSIGQISTFMASILLGGMLLQFPIGRLSDRFDRRTILLITALLTASACGSIIWITAQGFSLWIFVAAMIFGGFCYTIYPMASAQANDLAAKDKLVQVSAGLLFAYGLGASVGPVIASQLMGRFGPEMLFYFIIGNTCFLALFALARMAVRPAGVQKARFLPLGALGSSSKQIYSTVQSTISRRKRKTPQKEH
ncbi:MFS transporter [Sneathiella chinensis]|uniref:MFS transporter n=1 Tax=Sneathiella chinensis TaxID=349750 RepID=A0ABQ5U124_9PROT|nr:MFS transporter [Sneathiella chinensis]GLQ05528.1 MFS transporter [Sneathiella chinensis]